VSYGFYVCDDWLPNLTGALEDVGTPAYQRYVATGVHSHDDGVIHWHATTSASTGHNADLGVFLDVYDVGLSNDELDFPDDQLGGRDYIEGETKCGDEDGTLIVAVWDNYTDTGDPTVYTSDFRNIRVDQNSMVMVVAFIPESEDPRDIEMPPWAADLPALGAVDQGQLPPNVGPDGSTPIPDATAETPGSVPPGTATAATATAATTAASPADATAPTTVAPATTGG
jgi:hypothetical protein